MTDLHIYYTVRLRPHGELKVNLDHGYTVYFEDLHCSKNEADVRMKTFRDAAKLCGLEVDIIKHAQYVL